MPTYVYECQSCAKVFEVEQRIVEDALTDCDCGAKGSLKRLIQPTAVMFKGEGFFINDSTKSAPKVDSAPTEPAANSTPVTETKPAASAAETNSEPATKTSADNSSTT